MTKSAFETAPVAAKVAKTREKKPPVLEFRSPKLERYVAIRTIKAILDELEKSLAADLKKRAMARYVALGMKTGARPASWRGREGVAEAMFVMSVQGDVALLDDELALCKEAGVPFKTIDVENETLIINPAYKDNQEMLAKVEAALATITDLPADFIMKQSNTKTVLGENAIDTIFGIKDRKLLVKLLAAFTSMTIKSAKATFTKERPAINIVDELMVGQEENDDVAE